MREGEKTVCPHCGQTTFLKKKNILDGWKCVGVELVCAFCGKHIADLEETEQPAKAASDKLRTLLGADSETAKIKFDFQDAEKKFCKDCRFMISHPFHLRCEITGKTVEPMDDCSKFEKRAEEK